jgi:hypothetical protein
MKLKAVTGDRSVAAEYASFTNVQPATIVPVASE